MRVDVAHCKKRKQKTLTELLRAEERRKNKLRAAYLYYPQRFDGPNDSELKNVAGVVCKSSLEVRTAS